ncbi:DELTA-sagatoxin-Srs1a-like [Hippoglossus hippoglossus]|uniref:DELTA-sagatoxin-Srs1a-like n=1 Tax=Hippoglossus hippoglossus TaxID=8267 RepID=UPI00148CF90D|nr:DELTA-sagatoxin-Srs1a-like [Hippoglossus hippoglossus]XP_034450271.1 DELTA-sagatoxin-Srs1a-like [Hippoglossus hippoglossus]
MGLFDIVLGIVETVMSIGGTIVKAVPTHRQCNIEIENGSLQYTLCNPRMYIKRGHCRKPLPPTISQSSSGEVEFNKTPNTACGSVGIFAYELLNTSTKDTTEQIAVLFKVPFDLNLKSNEFAVGVFNISRSCNHGLFQEMSRNKGKVFVRGKAKGSVLTHKGKNVTVMATMSDCHTPVIRVQVMDA